VAAERESSVDALLAGLITYRQPRSGYRVSIEAPLLARFAIAGRSRSFAHIIDLGAGPGAVCLCLLTMGWAVRATAVEIDATHAALARQNLQLNSLAARATVVESDVGAAQCTSGDLVIANPPWFERRAGGIALDASRAAARAFTRGSLESFVRAARRLLAPRSTVVMSLPSSRTVEALATFAAVGLHAKRVRFVHPREGEEADVIFIEAKPGRPGGLVIERPWYVRGAGEDYTSETDDALRGRWPTPSR
jgi:tRNA1Val (adenine37-N6)-methyltransferase